MFVVWQLFGCSVLAFSIVFMITILVFTASDSVRIVLWFCCWEFYCVILLFWLCLDSLRELGCSIGCLV